MPLQFVANTTPLQLVMTRLEAVSKELLQFSLQPNMINSGHFSQGSQGRTTSLSHEQKINEQEHTPWVPDYAHNL